MFDVHVFRRGEALTDPDFSNVQELLKLVASDRPPLTRKVLEELFRCGTALATVYAECGRRSELVGMVTLCPIVRIGLCAIQLEDFIVHPAYRRQGAGRELIRQIRKIAHDTRIPTIRHGSTVSNGEAKAFLQKMGFAHSPSDAFILSVA